MPTASRARWGAQRIPFFPGWLHTFPDLGAFKSGRELD